MLGLTSFFNDFSSEMIYSIFPAFFTSVLKAGAGSLGMVDGIAEAASNFFKIYSGHLSDRWERRKPLVVTGYALSVMTRPFYMAIATVGGALGLRFVDRVGKGLRNTPRDAILSLSSPPEELGRSFGYHRAMDTMGAILGPLAAYFILLYFPLRFDMVFLTSFFIGLIAIGTLFFVSDITTAFKSKKMNLSMPASFSAQFKLLLFSIFVLSAGSLPVAVILLKTQSIGLIIATIPLFYMVYNISYAVCSPYAGIVSDRIGPRRVIIAGYAVLMMSYLAFNVAQDATTLSTGFLLLGLFPALTDGVQRAFVSRLTSEEVRGIGLGWLNAATGLGALVAGIAGGFIWQLYSPTVAFLAAAFVTIVGLGFFLAATRSTSVQ